MSQWLAAALPSDSADAVCELELAGLHELYDRKHKVLRDIDKEKLYAISDALLNAEADEADDGVEGEVVRVGVGDDADKNVSATAAEVVEEGGDGGVGGVIKS